MAPVSSISSKRSAPSDQDDDLAYEPQSKKRCVQPSQSQTPQPEEISLPIFLDRERFDDKPRVLLSRSVALALEHVGFDGASRQALEAMCDKVETC
jgi:transcription initiation factor TFIID subunit 8